MAQISSQSKDDLGYGSSSSRGPERCSRRRKGRSRDWKPCCLPAPSQLFEALNNLNNDSGEWNKRWQGELVETHKIFFFLLPLHMREGRLWLTMSGVSHWDRKNPPSHSLFARAMAVLLPSSIPSPFCSRAHMADIICRSILELFLVSLWHQLQGSRVTRAEEDVWCLCQPCPAWLPQRLAQNVEEASSTRFPSSSQTECVCAFVPGWG